MLTLSELKETLEQVEDTWSIGAGFCRACGEDVAGIANSTEHKPGCRYVRVSERLKCAIEDLGKFENGDLDAAIKGHPARSPEAREFCTGYHAGKKRCYEARGWENWPPEVVK
jgi:hypothetical protein